jgi:hypothetical protein
MCPVCRSTILKIRQIAGIERIRVLLTNTRKFHCEECGTDFRALDRREVSRQSGNAYSAARAAGILR